MVKKKANELFWKCSCNLSINKDVIVVIAIEVFIVVVVAVTLSSGYFVDIVVKFF